jgi:hypothetical protein
MFFVHYYSITVPHMYGMNIGDGFRHLVYHMENWMRYDATIVGWLVGPVFFVFHAGGRHDVVSITAIMSRVLKLQRCHCQIALC